MVINEHEYKYWFSTFKSGEIIHFQPDGGRRNPLTRTLRAGLNGGNPEQINTGMFPNALHSRNGNHPISLRKKLRQIRQHYGQRGKTKKDLVHKHFLCTSAAFTPALLTVHPPGGRSEEKDAWTEGMDNFHKSLLLLAYIQEKVYCLKTGGVISPSFTVTALLECATFKSWLMDVSLARWSQLK